jgi:pimeloyl-ACP methyl ester carboxylesterase
MHGFPDSPHTWDKLMPELAHAGYHAIAPYMRGYAPSSPAKQDLGLPDYSALATGHDVLDLVKAFNVAAGDPENKPAVLIGHDWGALAVYTATAIDDRLVSKLVTVAITHPSVINPLSPDFLPGGKSDHFAFLGLVPGALQWFSANDFQGVDYYFKKWSPDLQAGPDDMCWAKESFRNGGAAGAIGYYHSLSLLQNGVDLAVLNRKRTAVPTLTVYGVDDGATNVANFAKTPPAFVGCADDEGGPVGPSCHYKLVPVPHAGHFVQREAPAVLASQVLAFLAE